MSCTYGVTATTLQAYNNEKSEAKLIRKLTACRRAMST